MSSTEALSILEAHRTVTIQNGISPQENRVYNKRSTMPVIQLYQTNVSSNMLHAVFPNSLSFGVFDKLDASLNGFAILFNLLLLTFILTRSIFDQLDWTLNGLAILLNIFLLLFILMRRRLRKTICSKFFMNLQFVHLSMCVNALTVDGYGISDEHLYISNGLLVEIFLALLLTTIDRFVAIKYPYFYQRVTTKMVFTIIGISWIPGIVFVVVLLFIHAAEVVMALTTAILIAVAMLVLVSSNVMIWMIVRKHIKAVQKNCRPSSQSDIKDEKAKIKSTFVCLSIVITFVLLWLPYLVHNILSLTKVLSYGVFTRSLDSIILLNAILDPCLYVVFRKDVKKEMKMMIRKEREPATQLSFV